MSPAERSRHATIGRAKREWESTVDALDVLVCLLSPDGRIRRVNRVVEDWGLGPVAGVLDRSAHELLHPDCTAEHCALARFLQAGLPGAPGARRTRAALHLAIGERVLQCRLRPLRAARRRVADAHTVLLVADVTALHEARAALEQINAGLERRVRARTRALRRSNVELRAEVLRRRGVEATLRRSRNELAELSAQLIRAQEGERRLIARELHDSVGQSLSAVKYTVERALSMVRQPQLGDPGAVLALSVRRIQESAEAIRAISANLRPRILDDLGAASAVQWFCREFAETYPAIAVRVELGVADGAVPGRLTTVVYRCLQELMNNVAKHAQANTVWVRLRRTAGSLELQVRDDGVGIVPRRAGRTAGGAGLRNLRERAQMTGGQFRIGAPSGSVPGVRARVIWPLARPVA